jgi:uncharacterized protein YutE (UPF0331/DUF86 family)
MTKDELIPKLDQLIQSSDQFISDDHFVERSLISECQFWFSEVITWIRRSVGSDSFYCEEAVRIQGNSKRQGGIYIDDVRMMIGHLRQFRSAVYDDLLSGLHASISASDFDDFLDHAQEYHRLNRKIESSVIVSAVLEDSIKRIARTRGLKPSRKLEETLNALKSAGVFSANETKKLKYFSGIRNSALHADWDDFDLGDVGNIIAGVRDIIDAHLRS